MLQAGNGLSNGRLARSSEELNLAELGWRAASPLLLLSRHEYYFSSSLPQGG